MKTTMFKLSIALLLVTLFSSCNGSFEEVTIGNQVWMVENLNVDEFRNGDPIPQAKTVDEWKKATENEQPAWCYYDNDPSNGEKYGKLYNSYAVSDLRGLAPNGWHIPSEAEWTVLEDFLGRKNADIKMKNATGWKNETSVNLGNGSNESGFSGLPGGQMYSMANFTSLGSAGYWWATGGNFCSLSNYGFRQHYGSLAGNSVRCVKD